MDRVALGAIHVKVARAANYQMPRRGLRGEPTVGLGPNIREDVMDLTGELTAMAKAHGASLVGVAPVERFQGAPTGHHPTDLLPGAQTVLSFGIRLLDRVLEWPELLQGSPSFPEEMRKDALHKLFYRRSGYDIVNDHLNTVALLLANHLEDLGFPSLFFPATYGGVVETMPNMPGMFSQRHAAVRAGLGEFGLNNVVVTERYGPRIRFNAVLTTAPLTPVAARRYEDLSWEPTVIFVSTNVRRVPSACFQGQARPVFGWIPCRGPIGKYVGSNENRWRVPGDACASVRSDVQPILDRRLREGCQPHLGRRPATAGGRCLKGLAREQFSLTGKTAVVTGGGRGIGKSIALALAEAMHRAELPEPVKGD